MVNTCPNCSHPLRPSAKFCGYCGTDLMAARDDKALQGAHGKSLGERDAKAIMRANARQKDPFRTISYIAIMLLILIILAAVAWQYWPEILPVISQLLPGLLIK